MPDEVPEAPQLPFQAGDWVIDRANPGQPCRFTGETQIAGEIIMCRLEYIDGHQDWRPAHMLEPMRQRPANLHDRLCMGPFGRARDLKRLITYEKLKGTLHEVVYSMEAAQVDFYPYQYKPVLKFIESPTQRLILADEVGIGKTIESALIWLELQARHQAKRLLIVCPKMIAEQWQIELRQKFSIDAKIADFEMLRDEVNRLRGEGPSHSFVLIATYTGLRPARGEHELLGFPPDYPDMPAGGPKTYFLRQLKFGEWTQPPFDLVVFDEAAHMRNPGTANFRLGEALAENAGAVLCVSATPVNTSNRDLHTLLRLIDPDSLESQVMFEELLAANKGAVRAANALGRVPVDTDMLSSALDEMQTSRFIADAPQYQTFKNNVSTLDPNDVRQVVHCQRLAEKLNILGKYINRTRRRQIQELSTVRTPKVIELDYSSEEMALYNAILSLVRIRCQEHQTEFHMFQVIGLQLRAASCLPALAQDLRDSGIARLINDTDPIEEALEDDLGEALATEENAEVLTGPELELLLAFDYEANDSKYQQLCTMLRATDEKVIVFAFYRSTLEYLRRRLLTDGFGIALIHGQIDIDQRLDEIKRFRDTSGLRILLSSEVGSEGLNLQFCRILVNYDLPWNPMRVEQRIGRIDRIGQRSDTLVIANFKVRNTIEERLYECLLEHIGRFENTIGDLEGIIGREIRQLTIDIFRNERTPDQERQRIQQSCLVIANQHLEMQNLEERGDVLLAHSDYLQRKIKDAQGKGRFMQADEMEDYVTDFFEREFQGCQLNHDAPVTGCLRIRLSAEARTSLGVFIQNNNIVNTGLFHQSEFTITFRRDVMEDLDSRGRQQVRFINHMSPLIRWITKRNKDNTHKMFDVSALTVEAGVFPEEAQLEPGIYTYLIERWILQGLLPQERFAYAVAPLNSPRQPAGGDAEGILQYVLRAGSDWDYCEVVPENLDPAYFALEEKLAIQFKTRVTEFCDENATTRNIREQRLKAHYDRRIAQDNQRLETLRQNSRAAGLISATEQRIQNTKGQLNARLEEVQRQAVVDPTRQGVAAGVFRVL